MPREAGYNEGIKADEALVISPEVNGHPDHEVTRFQNRQWIWRGEVVLDYHHNATSAWNRQYRWHGERADEGRRRSRRNLAMVLRNGSSLGVVFLSN